MAAKKLWIYRVEGHGYFPVDMLRYDASYPHSTEDAGNMVVMFRDDLTVTRQVELCSTRSGPTEGRWLSFGWKVVGKVTERKLTV